MANGEAGLALEVCTPDEALEREILGLLELHEEEFFPPLSSRGPLLDYVTQFREARAFVTTCREGSRLVGFLATYEAHPRRGGSWHQCILVVPEMRGQRLARTLYCLADEELARRGSLFVSGQLWHGNASSLAALRASGYFVVETVLDDRGRNQHALRVRKCLFDDGAFSGIEALGIVGGMGTLASAHFATRVARVVANEEIEQDQLAFFLSSDPSAPDRTAAILGGELESLTAFLNRELRRIAEFGPSHILVCCHTAHAVLELVGKLEGATVVSLVDLTHALISRCGAHVLVLGTDGTIAFQRTSLAGQSSFPNEDAQRLVHGIIGRLKVGFSPEVAARILVGVVNETGASTVVMACSELSMVAEPLQRMMPQVVVVDPLEVAAFQIARAAQNSPRCLLSHA